MMHASCEVENLEIFREAALLNFKFNSTPELHKTPHCYALIVELCELEPPGKQHYIISILTRTITTTTQFKHSITTL